MAKRLIETSSQEARSDSGLDQSGLSRQQQLHGHPPLSLPVRIALHVVGWALVAVGLAGLVLPGIQGILTGALGLALVSVASDNVHRWLRSALRRWPWVWDRVERFRHRIHDRLHRATARRPSGGPPPG